MGKSLKGKDLGKGLYQRADGLYEARAVVKGQKINLYNKDLKILKLKFEERKKQVLENIDLEYVDINLMTWFNEWFDKYKKPVIKESSINPMKRRFRNAFEDSIGVMRIMDITNIVIQKQINSLLDKGVAVSTIREEIGLLSQCLESAKRNKLISENPCFDLVVPKGSDKKVKREFLSQAEQDEFLLAVRGQFYEEMFYTMFLTGLRIGELGALSWCDVDFKGKYIEVNRALSCEYSEGVKKLVITTPKTLNAYRKIPFMGELEEKLKSQKVKQDNLKKKLGARWRASKELGNLVFTTNMGSPIIRHVGERAVRAVVREINLNREYLAKKNGTVYEEFPKVYPHAIRHSFCSRCFEKGMNPKVVQKLMGHAYYSTTIDIYTHVVEESMKEDIDKFGSALVRKPDTEYESFLEEQTKRAKDMSD